jgi:hypothetical protein
MSGDAAGTGAPARVLAAMESDTRSDVSETGRKLRPGRSKKERFPQTLPVCNASGVTGDRSGSADAIDAPQGTANTDFSDFSDFTDLQRRERPALSVESVKSAKSVFVVLGNQCSPF